MLRGTLALVATAAAAFALGWGARPRTVSAAPTPITQSSPGSDSGVPSCGDDDAMKANQNLVDQLQDARRAQMIAEAKAHLAELRAKSAEQDRTKPGTVRGNRDEWARMAKDGKVRLRTPCGSWNQTGAFRLMQPGRASVRMGRGSDVHQRAAGAGLEEEDRELIAKAYESAHARTWQSMKSACEEGRFFKEAINESNPESDADRVAICQASLLPNESNVRAALKRVAESRASGSNSVAPGAGSEPQDRVAYALSESVDVLYDEMKKVLGEEKATRAMDYGVLCTNEASYDLSSSDEG